MAALSLLPTDVLLDIFRDLGVVDVVHTGLTCKDLHQTVQDRHVWIDQLEKLCQEDPVLRPAIPPLTSLSAQELKTFVAGRVKLRARWDNCCDEPSYVTKALVGIPGLYRFMLLPGGKFLLVVDNDGGVSLRRIELGPADGQGSLPVVASFESDRGRPATGLERSKLLTTTSPHPILVHTSGPSVSIFSVDQHNGAMVLEATPRLPNEYLRVDGQGRVLGFLVENSPNPPRVVIIHLDHPGVTVESDVLPVHELVSSRRSYVWSMCVPTERLLVAFNSGNALAYKIPNFSNLSPGVHRARAAQLRSWHTLDRTPWSSLTHTASEALYDQLSAQKFDLYFLERGGKSRVITVTVPINIWDYDDLAAPIPKQESTVVRTDVDPSDGISLDKGLYFSKTCNSGRIDYLVSPLRGLASGEQGKFLRISFSREDLSRNLSLPTEIDIDEATGRVVICVWDKRAQEPKIFVRDLV